MRRFTLLLTAVATVVAASMTIGSDSADAFNRCKRFNVDGSQVLRCR